LTWFVAIASLTLNFQLERILKGDCGADTHSPD